MSLFSIHTLEPLESSFLQTPATLEITLLIPAKNSAHAIENTVLRAIEFFEATAKNQYEIILIPNQEKGDTQDLTHSLALKLASRYPAIQIVPHHALPGKGAALRTGLRAARGKFIFYTDADLPYELEFFNHALSALRSGYALVTGNRRLASSHFNIPVELLPVAYKRHRLGLAFNQVVRLFFPVETSDTQAGIKAMTRDLAREAFTRMKCPGFFFDLEIFLTARASGYPQKELPVVLFLNTEKSTVRILREGLLAVYWLTRIFFRYRSDLYARNEVLP